MSLDDHVGAWADVQRSAEELTHRFERALSGGTVTGVDDTRCVTVTVDTAGRMTRLDLQQGWRAEIGSRLGTAIIAALDDAAQQRLAAWAAATAAGNAPSDTAPRAPDPLTAAEAGDPASHQSRHAIRELLDLIRRVDDQLPALLDRARAAARPVDATNANRTVRVRVRNNEVASIDLDQNWVRDTTDARLTADLAATVTAAQRIAADQREQVWNDSPDLARLRRLTESPEVLLREVGLIR